MTAEVVRNTTKSKRERQKSRLRMSEAKTVLSWGLILALAALVGAIYLYQTSRIASVGRHVQELQLELDETKRVNAALEREIAEAQSLERLQEEAIRQGFVRAQPDQIEYLVITDMPAPAVASETPASPEVNPPVESMGEAIWLALRSALRDFVRGDSP